MPFATGSVVRRDGHIASLQQILGASILAAAVAVGTGTMTTAASYEGQTGATGVEAPAQRATAAIPEPAGLILFGAGLLAVARQMRRRRVQSPRASERPETTQTRV